MRRSPKGFGVGLGDTLTLSVLGLEIEAEIASLRAIDWRSLRFDFAIIFSPGLLEGAPHSHIAALEVPPEGEDQVESAVGDAFANISIIRVREALEAARGLIENIGSAVRAASSISLLTGVLVLAGAIAAGHRQRVYDAVVFKVLGATRGKILAAHLVEYGILGAFTGLTAAAVGTLTAWAVIVFLMKSDWVFLPGTALGATLICVGLAISGGLLGTWIALGRKAAPLLRNE